MAIFSLKIPKNKLGKASKNAPKLPRKKLQKTQKSGKSLFFTDASPSPSPSPSEKVKGKGKWTRLGAKKISISKRFCAFLMLFVVFICRLTIICGKNQPSTDLWSPTLAFGRLFANSTSSEFQQFKWAQLFFLLNCIHQNAIRRMLLEVEVKFLEANGTTYNIFSFSDWNPNITRKYKGEELS